MSEELLPCPFCGSRPSVKPANPEIDGDAWTSIGCSNISSCGQASVTVYAERGHFKKAAAKWNRRAPIAQQAEPAGAPMVELGSANVARAAMEVLSDSERLGVMNQYCTGCGSKDTDCQCWNDD